MNARELPLSRYHDKVLGGWVGKSLGGSVGHFEGTKRITRFRVRDLLTEGVVANDDLDIQLVWLDVLLEKGVRLDGSDLMAAWIERYDYNFGEYGFARRNFRRGIRPPVSGSFANRYYASGMGCAIRSEVWGMIAPGDPREAARLAGTDGSIDHAGDAVDAERFLAAMEAEAFLTGDLERLLAAGLPFVHPAGKLAACIGAVRESRAAGLAWQQVWRRLVDDHGHPDCTHAPLNLGFIVMALLYGEGNMERSLEIAVNSGWDVDCTCSTTAALLGIVQGWSGFAAEWRDYVGDAVVTLARLKRAFTSLRGVSDATCAAGLAAAREGTLATRILIDNPAIADRMPVVPQAVAPPAVELSVTYPDGPEIRAGGTRVVEIAVSNRGTATVSGRLGIEAPPGWSAEPGQRDVSVGPSGTARIAVTLQAPSEGVLADAVPFTATLGRTRVRSMPGAAGADRPAGAAPLAFGLAGAAVGLALGPFFDSYDEWLDRSRLPPKRVLRTATDEISLPEAGEEWGNHRVDLAKAYLDEDFSDPVAVRRRFAVGRRADFSEDCLKMADVFGMVGPCCVYVLLEIECPSVRAMQLFLGSTDPFVLWWNGSHRFTQSANRFWFPNNDVVDVRAARGPNQIVLKLLRTGADNRFSIVFREPPVLTGYDSCPFVTDLGWRIPGPGCQEPYRRG